MAAFGKSTFSAASYAAFRPTYPASLLNTLLKYHHGPRILAIDLGCGPGTLTRDLGPHFEKVIGVDPSEGMIKKARETSAGNFDWQHGNAEVIADQFKDESVDFIVAGQAAHWFDFDTLWPKLQRIVRKGGTVAFFGYKDHVFVDFPKASTLMQKYAYDLDPNMLGSYWQQPGRSFVQDKLRHIKPPTAEWSDVEHIEYEPGTAGPHTGEGTLFMEKELKVGECMSYIRTWSSVHGWEQAHPDQKARPEGEGDIVDEFVDEAAIEEPHFADLNNTIRIEWGSGLVLARRR